MLLSQKPHAIQYLPRSGTCRLQAALEIRIFFLQSVDSLRIDASSPGCRVDCFNARFCLESATPESRELITKMPNELMQLLECFDVRTFAGGCQVPPLDP